MRNIELFKQIENVYKNQVNKLVKIYEKYNIRLGNIKQDETELNIIRQYIRYLLIIVLSSSPELGLVKLSEWMNG